MIIENILISLNIYVIFFVLKQCTHTQIQKYKHNHLYYVQIDTRKYIQNTHKSFINTIILDGVTNEIRIKNFNLFICFSFQIQLVRIQKASLNWKYLTLFIWKQIKIKIEKKRQKFNSIYSRIINYHVCTGLKPDSKREKNQKHLYSFCVCPSSTHLFCVLYMYSFFDSFSFHFSLDLISLLRSYIYCSSYSCFLQHTYNQKKNTPK